jgi:hypothetical protein
VTGTELVKLLKVSGVSGALIILHGIEVLLLFEVRIIDCLVEILG